MSEELFFQVNVSKACSKCYMCEQFGQKMSRPGKDTFIDHRPTLAAVRLTQTTDSYTTTDCIFNEMSEETIPEIGDLTPDGVCVCLCACVCLCVSL